MISRSVAPSSSSRLAHVCRRSRTQDELIAARLLGDLATNQLLANSMLQGVAEDGVDELPGTAGQWTSSLAGCSSSAAKEPGAQEAYDAAELAFELGRQVRGLR